jgi:predicted methyltransferase
LAESLVDRIVCGDCKDILPQILSDFIDCLITDPPTASPLWEKIETGRFRVLKSGGSVCGC